MRATAILAMLLACIVMVGCEAPPVSHSHSGSKTLRGDALGSTYSVTHAHPGGSAVEHDYAYWNHFHAVPEPNPDRYAMSHSHIYNGTRNAPGHEHNPAMATGREPEEYEVDGCDGVSRDSIYPPPDWLTSNIDGHGHWHGDSETWHASWSFEEEYVSYGGGAGPTLSEDDYSDISETSECISFKIRNVDASSGYLTHRFDIIERAVRIKWTTSRSGIWIHHTDAEGVESAGYEWERETILIAWCGHGDLTLDETSRACEARFE